MNYIFFIPEVLMFLLSVYIYRLPPKTSKRLFAWICLLWALIFGFRSYGTGNDTPDYWDFFINKSSQYGNVNGYSELEIGFLYFAKFVKFFSDSPTLFFIVISSCLFIAIYRLYTKHSTSSNYFIGLLAAFLLVDLFVPLMVAIRQATSFCILIPGILLLTSDDSNIVVKKNKNKIFVGLCLLSMSILVHKSSIIIVPFLLLIYFVPINRMVLAALLCVCVIMAFIFMEQIGYIFNTFFIMFGDANFSSVNPNVMNIYANDFGDNKQKTMTFVAWALPAFLNLYLADEKQIKSFYYRCYIISVCVFLLFSSSFLVHRIVTPLILLGFTQYLPSSVKPKSRWYKVYLFFVLALLIKAFLRYGNWPATDTSLPYHFFWQ